LETNIGRDHYGTYVASIEGKVFVRLIQSSGSRRRKRMIRAALFFFVVALVAYILGLTGVAGLSLEVGRILLGTFLILSAITLLAGIFLLKGGSTKRLP
jgi:uncharacterized membrane protein YtjA (UPF0391 family)